MGRVLKQKHAMQTISSPSNPRLKEAMQLHTARGRKKQNRIIIFGQREIDRAISAGIVPDQIFVPPNSSAVEGFDKTKIYQLAGPLFEKLNYGNRLDDAIMTAARPSTDLKGVNLKGPGLVAILEAIEKPGNLGGILRSADGSGVKAVIVADPLTDVFHPNSIRNSCGAAFNVPTAVGNSRQVIAALKSASKTILVATPDAEKNLHQVDLKSETAIVLGNEANGVSQQWIDAADERFRLPMLGVADSLNVSVTAAIVMYESLRQRS